MISLEMNFHFPEMRDLLIADEPPTSDEIVNVEVGYSFLPTTFDLRTHLMQGWYAEKITLDIGNETPEALPEN